MSTKQAPGLFDDYADLANDEPYFILRAKRSGDAVFVKKWAADQRIGDTLTPRGDDAYHCAEQMEVWRETNVKASDADEILLAACIQLHEEKHDPNIAFVNCPETICVLRRRAVADIADMKKVKP